MADNVDFQSASPATPASGTKIATDDVGVNGGTTAQVQFVKLVDGTANGTDGIQGTAANGLEVDVTRVPKGSKTFSDPAPTNSAASIVAANSSRKSLLIQNVGTVSVYLGSTSGVTTSNGLLLSPGATISDDTSTDAWYGITASGTADLRICEIA